MRACVRACVCVCARARACVRVCVYCFRYYFTNPQTQPPLTSPRVSVSVQVKRLLPDGACAQTHSLHVGDRLLECNGQSLQGLTQARCLDVLKAAGPRVTLTLLHPLKQGEDAAGGDSARVERADEHGAEGSPGGERLGVKKTKTGSVGVGGGGGGEVNGDDGGGDPTVPDVTRADVISNADRHRGSEGGEHHTATAAAGTRTRNVQPHRGLSSSSSSSSSSSKEDGAVRRQPTPEKQPAKEEEEDVPTDAMSSNPFLDPPPPSAEEEVEEDGGCAPDEPAQHPALSKTNPFYQDLLAEPHGQSGVQQLSRPDSDTLIDFASGLNDHAHGDGSLGALLDVSDGGMVGPHSSSSAPSSAATATDGAQSNGGVDLLGSNFTQFGESDVNIPPPMEFSDFGNHHQHHDHQHHAPLEPSDDGPATATSPVTNIDDLLGVDFSANGGLPPPPQAPPPATAAATTTEPARNGATDDGAENGFDFLLDAEEAREQPPAASLADITEEETPRLPPGPPPPVPAAKPPPSPAAPVPAEEFLGDGTDPSEASATTSVFLPSENPMDNITMISVCPERSEAAGSLSGSSSKNNNNNNNTVHVTDITVTSPTPKVSAVNVTRPKPAPRGRDGGQDSKASAGTAVVTVGQPTTPNVTQIRFDTSTSETFIRSTLPPNAFVPTSVGITKAIKKPNSPRRSQAVAGEVEEKEEEEEPITPMMVHRDHRGNKLAAPSPPESLGRQTNGPRAVDGEAKRDLHDILAQMTKSTRGLPLARNGAAAASEDEEPAVAEDEIVPVQLSRKETETAQAVLSKWLSEEPKASSPSFSVSKAASPAKKSGFQKAVGTLIDVQSGKVELPSGSVLLTTMGVTKTPKKKGASQEEEVEEAITPMAVHKDHLGNKHYAPSPPESLGKRSGVRKLDSAAKEDIAAILSGMPTRSVGARKSAAGTGKETEPAVAEDAIVATVLSKKEARVAMDTVARWMSGDSGPPPPRPKPSPFQRLVDNVMDSSAAAAANKTETDEAGKEASRDPVSEASDKADGVAVSDSVATRPEAAVELVVEPSRSSSTASAPAPPSEPEEPPSSSSSEPPRQKPAPPPTSPKPPSPQQAPPPSKLTMANRRTLFEQPEQTPLVPTRKEPGPKVTRIEIGAKAGTTTTTVTNSSSSAPTTAAEPKPVPSQRSLRPPAKFGSLSQASSLTVKPLSMKIGSLSVGSRGLPAVGSSSLSSSSVSSKLPAKVEYGKVRTDEAPFLVEVLKGILGLGIKVKVNGEGHVEVTEVQRNSPVDKNGNVK